MTGVMETDIIFIPEQKNSRSRQICCFFCVYEREKHTSIRIFQRSSCNTRHKNSLTFSMIFFIIFTLNLSKTNELLTLLLRLRGQA